MNLLEPEKRTLAQEFGLLADISALVGSTVLIVLAYIHLVFSNGALETVILMGSVLLLSSVVRRVIGISQKVEKILKEVQK